MDYLKKIIIDFKILSVEGIKECFENGVDPNLVVNGKPLIYELIHMYLRGPQFKNCVKTKSLSFTFFVFSLLQF